MTQQQRDGYPPLCPDFVVELRSLTDSLEELQAKMQEYMDNGARLGWLINPQDRLRFTAQGRRVEVLQSPTSLLGEDVLCFRSGFCLTAAGSGIGHSQKFLNCSAIALSRF